MLRTGVVDIHKDTKLFMIAIKGNSRKKYK